MSLWFLVPFELFLPGYAWILFSGLNRRFGIAERLAISFIISISFTSLFTAGLSLVTSHYLSYSVGGSLALSLILLILSFRHGNLFRRSLPKLDRTMLPVIATACIYVAVFISLFWSSPFYPTTDADDPITHAQVVEGILQWTWKNAIASFKLRDRNAFRQRGFGQITRRRLIRRYSFSVIDGNRCLDLPDLLFRT